MKERMAGSSDDLFRSVMHRAREYHKRNPLKVGEFVGHEEADKTFQLLKIEEETGVCGYLNKHGALVIERFPLQELASSTVAQLFALDMPQEQRRKKALVSPSGN